MAFDENEKKIENVYEKMIHHLSEEVMGDEYYQYYYNLLETGTNYVDFFNSRLLKSIDEEWVNAIEETLIPLQNAVTNPRKFIEEDREIVNVAMARNVSAESIQHLLQHSSMIDQVNEDGTVIPNHLLTVYKEESLNTYENRFVCTLIIELQRFINKRFEVIFDTSQDERGTFFKAESLIDNYTETIDYKLEIKIREKQTAQDNLEENEGIFSRISKIHQKVNDLASSGFMTTMRQYPPVRHPIVKTNAIGKNQNYKACHKLWNYIHSYDRIGYKIDMVKQQPMVSGALERDIYNSFLWNYFMIRHFVEDTDQLNINRPKREKEVSVKYVRQVLSELLDGLDMSDENARKLINNELYDLQLKRKIERVSANDAIRKAKGRASKKNRKREDKK